MITSILKLDSWVLRRPVEVFCFLPYSMAKRDSTRKLIFALHPAMEDGSFYANQLGLTSSIDKENFVLVSPSLGNYYFVDSRFESQSTFLKDELYPLIKQFFACDSKACLLGVSMGAFGAAYWALSDKEQFDKVALISGFFDPLIPLDDRVNQVKEQKILAGLFFKNWLKKLMFDDEEGGFNPKFDIRSLVKSKEKGNYPSLGLWCGDHDYLSLKQTDSFECFCNEVTIPAKKHVTQGGHNIEYWQDTVKEALKWLIN